MLIKRYIYMAHAHKHGGKFEVLSRPGALRHKNAGGRARITHTRYTTHTVTHACVRDSTI